MVTLADTECILCVATFSCTLPSDSSTKLVRGAPAWGMKQAPEAREAAQIVKAGSQTHWTGLDFATPGGLSAHKLYWKPFIFSKLCTVPGLLEQCSETDLG